jgi:transcriptional regulator with XRE-family HTH domain
MTVISNSALGQRLRAERLLRKMTLKDVEGQSGFSATHISEIERGRTCPTINALVKISEALQRDPSYFIEREELPDFCMVEAHQRPSVMMYGEVRVDALTCGVAGARLHAFQIDLPEGPQGRIDFDGHYGEESGYILSGRIEVRVGDERRVLDAGDGFHFFSRKPHGFRNSGTEGAALVLVTSHRTLSG